MSGVFIGPNDGGGTVNTNSGTNFFSVTQANAFTIGQVIRFDPTSQEWILAQADTADDAEWLGVVYSCTSTSFVWAFNGYIDLTGSGLTFVPGDVYYLSAATAGALTPTEPSPPNISAPVFFAVSTTQGFIRNHRGIISSNGAQGAQFTTIDDVGIFGMGVKTITGNTLLDNTASTWLCNATAAGFTVTLPQASVSPRRLYNIIKIDGTNNVVTITPDNTIPDTIDGVASVGLFSRNHSVNIQPDAVSAWWSLPPKSQLFKLYAPGFNMNSASDQSINIPLRKYILRKVTATNASTSLTTASGGLYTGTSKSGLALVASNQAYTQLTSSTQFLDATLTSNANSVVLTANPLYLSLSTAQGGAATADIVISGDIIQS